MKSLAKLLVFCIVALSQSACDTMNKTMEVINPPEKEIDCWHRKISRTNIRFGACKSMNTGLLGAFSRGGQGTATVGIAVVGKGTVGPSEGKDCNPTRAFEYGSKGTAEFWVNYFCRNKIPKDVKTAYQEGLRKFCSAESIYDVAKNNPDPIQAPCVKTKEFKTAYNKGRKEFLIVEIHEMKKELENNSKDYDDYEKSIVQKKMDEFKAESDKL